MTMMGLLSADVDVVAILVAAVANTVLGMIWYSPGVFGTLWMDLAGIKPKNKKEEEAMKAAMMPAMGIGFLLSIIMAYVLGQFVGLLELTTATQGAQLGFWTWLGFAGAVTLSNHQYTMKPTQLWYINAGYRLIAFMVMGAILTTM